MKNELSITLVSAGCTISGDMIVDHGISYFGLLDGGLISTQGLLHVGNGGLIKGNVQGDHVRIDGRVDGNVHARGALEINGHVSGDIMYCGTIRLGPRAALNGTLKRVSRMLTIEPATDESTNQQVPVVDRGVSGPERQESNVTEFTRAKA
ncbi:polymer-forming cytoskeletal protein [Paraburkholderia dipogonis]|uniref:Polymer-forming cytoskeletal protein n=1 Tax=Paraburkholderia dipogonis TaxID=1211383 RepID=A0A4Y8MHK0_9BURK|nr:polymer-forming cytoskeletal protein [Paraburkholderia dipogonis]TFE36911.1 polymer-forming cytoskeletal protein [Paraburkholderia dipogonis]